MCACMLAYMCACSDMQTHVYKRASKNMCIRMFPIMVRSRKFPHLRDTLSASGDKKGSHEWLIRMQLSTALGKTT